MCCLIMCYTTKKGVLFIYLIKQLQLQKEELSNQITALSKSLKTFPTGKLICSRNGTCFKWYHSDGKHKTYIPKKNQSYAEQLAIKKYITLKYDDLIRQRKAINSFLRQYPSYSQAEQLLNQSSAFHQLLTPYFKLDEESLLDWVNAPYESNPYHPEHLTHKTLSGRMVRSKSEALIDTILYTKKIPYRYECLLYLNGKEIYPDFTIKHPISHQLLYWEHLGKMDDPEYSRKAYEKIQLYINNGFVPGVNLILTFETQEHPLTIDYVNHIVEYYFP